MLLLETYKETATRALQELENANLKGLLRRVLGKIFNDLEIKGWCREFEVRNGVREGEEITEAEAIKKDGRADGDGQDTEREEPAAAVG
jgi:hypothetical protein